MSRAKPRSRRRQLIVRYVAWSVLLTAGATAGALLLHRDDDAAYLPGDAVEGITNELLRGLPAERPDLRFTDATREAGIDFRHFRAERSTQLPEDIGSGAAWGDYDGDGDWDLYICDIAHALGGVDDGTGSGNRLYRNNGDGTFTDVTEPAGVGFRGLAMAAAWADYDGDGTLDLAVSAYGRLVLYRSRGDGTFEESADRAGLAGFDGFWTGLSWADYDGDGRLDLYVCGYVRYDFRPEYLGRASQQYARSIPFTLNPSSYKPERNLLFRNQGDGTFREVAAQAGVANPEGRSLSASWADFDLDGRLDLYVANDVSDNALFRNRGDGTFEDVSHPAWAADYRGAMGLAVGDYDEDGDLDLFVTHWIAQENGLLWNLLRGPTGASAAGLLRFTDVADMQGLGQISLNDIGWGTSFVDFDLDGRLDIFVANGSTFEDAEDRSRLVPMRDRLFWQKSPEEGFFDLSEVAGEVFGAARVSRGAAFADYDSDGDIDVLIVNHQGPPTLLRNDSATSNRWLKVRVGGASGDSVRVGTVVELETGSGARRRVSGSQSSYMSQNAPEAHFGLGSKETVRRVRVRFPSGVESVIEDASPNQTLLVRE